MKKVTFSLLFTVLGLFLSTSLMSQECDISKEYDQFRSTTRYSTNYVKWMTFFKVVKGEDTLFLCHMWTQSTVPNYYSKGVIILFQDSSKIEKPEEKIDCKIGSISQYGTVYNYSATILLTEKEIEQLKTKLTTGFQLFAPERTWGEKKAIKIQESFNCLLKTF